MVTIPLYIFLFIYFGFLVIFTIFSIINIAHIVGTGTLTFASFAMTAFVFAFTVFALWATWFFLQGTDWQQPVTIWNSAWFNLNGNGIVNF